MQIYKLQNDGSQKVVSTCKLSDDGEVICEGEEVFTQRLMQDGILDYTQSGENKIFPKDGLRFLEQLKYNFKSGYLNASEIKEL